MREETALADLQRGGEFADREPFKAFERCDIHGSLQNRAASFYAARTPPLIRCRNASWRGGCQWQPRMA